MFELKETCRIADPIETETVESGESAPPDLASLDGPTANRRAMESFEQRYVLSGVSIRRNECVVFPGWDRETLRAVEVVIKPCK